MSIYASLPAPDDDTHADDNVHQVVETMSGWLQEVEG